MTAVFLVLVSVFIFGGFALEGGPLHAIISVWQEYLIIFGGGACIYMAMMPQKIFKHIMLYVGNPFKANKYDKDVMLEVLKMRISIEGIQFNGEQQLKNLVNENLSLIDLKHIEINSINKFVDDIIEFFGLRLIKSAFAINNK
jgi:flagellar motor component MotA